MMAFSLIETSRLYAHVGRAFQSAVGDAGCRAPASIRILRTTLAKRGRGGWLHFAIHGFTDYSSKVVNASTSPPLIRSNRGSYLFNAHWLKVTIAQVSEVVNANRKLIEHYQQQEDKYRRRDIQLSDKLLYEFYDTRTTRRGGGCTEFRGLD